MSDIEFSVISCTFRPGGIDVLLAGMRDQTFPRKQFEVIIVDRRWEFRHQEVMALAKEYGLPNVVHVPEYRRNGKWACIGSSWNTGFAVARGNVLGLLQDFAYAPPGWIEAHFHWHTPHSWRYIVGPYTYLGLPPLQLKPPYDSLGFDFSGDRLHCTQQGPVLQGKVLDEMFIFQDGMFDPAWLKDLPRLDAPQDPRSHAAGAEIPDTHLHIKNESIRRDVAYRLNGLDERLDRGKGPLDLDWGLRLSSIGAKMIWDPATHTPALNSRLIVPTMPWGTMNKRLEGRWSWQDGLAYNARRRAECSHEAPEAKNPTPLRTLSLALEEWRHDPAIDVARLEVPDALYWGPAPIWPDTPYHPARQKGVPTPDPPAPADETARILAPWQSKGDPPPPGGTGPICEQCGFSRWVEIGGGRAADVFHPNLDQVQDPNVDIVVDLEAGTLPFHDGHAERVKAIHALQHLSRDGARAILRESYRILRPGGSLYIMIGDGDFLIERLKADGFVEAWMSCLFHGPNVTEQSFHRWMYNDHTIREELTAARFECIEDRGPYNAWERKYSCRKPL